MNMLYPVLVVLLLVFKSCEQSNILIISTVASHSHSLWCNKLAELLLGRGHVVTILDTDPPRKKLTNLITYTLEGAYNYTDDLDYHTLSSENSPKKAADFLLGASITSCKAMLHSQTFRKFLEEHSHKKKPFDLIIHDITNCECFLGLVPTLGWPKLVLVTAFGESNALHVLGHLPNFFHNPLHMSPYSVDMSYLEKFKNFFHTLYHHYKFRQYINEINRDTKIVFGNSTQDVMDIAKSSAVALVNAHPVFDGAKYYSPAIVHIAGFHIDEPKKLDKDTQAFLEGAEHGAIYFSLGTNIQSAVMSKDKIDIFINVFKNLKQRVLWKFESDSITNFPKNVLVSKWYSQNDVLAHPNIKMFITHCGLLSTQEAIYHGVPMISMPFMIDQHFITTRLSKKGLVVPLLYSTLTEHNLKEAINLILINESYRTEIKKMSNIFRDQVVKPKDLAIHWIEYVLRNDNLKFLHPPETFLSTLEVFLLDIKTILGIIIGILITAIYHYYSYKPYKQVFLSIAQSAHNGLVMHVMKLSSLFDYCRIILII